MSLQMESINRFDLVHDCQQVFRLLLTALSNPGSWHSYASQAAKFDQHGLWLPLALTLCDLETKFRVVCCATELCREIIFLSNAQQTSMEAADFIFCGKGSDPQQILPQVRSGSFADPHKSATVFVLATSAGNSEQLLSGPGIPEEGLQTVIPEEAVQWLDMRDALNYEYPLGVDIFIVHPQAKLMGLPRTTRRGRS